MNNNKLMSGFITSLFFVFTCLAGCSRTNDEVNPPPPELPPTLTINPGLSINIPYNSSATFSWTTNGTGVTVNGVAYPSGTYTTPILQTSTTYTVKSNSVNYANNGLSTIVQVTVSVGVNPDSINIYCSGFDNGKIVYWKDSIENILAVVPNYNGRGNGISIIDTNVYVVGHASGTAVYWKNGNQINLVNNRVVTEATSITVSGSDVYIGGYDVSPNANLAVYWKNGVEVILAAALPLTSVNAIAVSGGNVYAAGFIGDSAVIWENGTRTTLSNGYARANAIAISGNDIYVAGTENGVAVYWKNGVKTSLPSAAVATANAIAISGTDVYVAGTDNTNNATYWKNGVKMVLSTLNSSAKSIALFNGDVYISGWLPSQAVYWKNGIKKIIPSFSSPPGSFVEASGIIVKYR